MKVSDWVLFVPVSLLASFRMFIWRDFFRPLHYLVHTELFEKNIKSLEENVLGIFRLLLQEASI